MKTASKRIVGFTLIELLVVIAIIAILAALLLPALNKAKDSAKRVGCISNYHQVHLMLVCYQNDFNGFYPALTGGTNLSTGLVCENACGQGLPSQLSLYAKNKDTGSGVLNRFNVFTCPADRDPNHTAGDLRNNSYGGNDYCWVNTVGDDLKALRPESIRYKYGGISDVIFMAEVQGIAPLKFNGSASFANSRTNDTYGTAYNFNFLARHNKNLGMNFLYFDGHVQFNKDISVNSDVELLSMRNNSY